MHRILGERHLEQRHTATNKVRCACEVVDAPTPPPRGQVVLEALPQSLAPCCATSSTAADDDGAQLRADMRPGFGHDMDNIRNAQVSIRKTGRSTRWTSSRARRDGMGPSSWADAGEEQRVSLQERVRHLRRPAVVAVTEWGDPTADYVLIRDPMVIAAFASVVRPLLHHGACRSPTRARRRRACASCELGLKDESIARWLQPARTARDGPFHRGHRVQTRFQVPHARGLARRPRPPQDR